MPSDPRASIAEAQTAFLGRLGGTAPPGGFDAGKVRLAGDALARKRARSAAKAWPRVAKELGDRFAEVFAAYASERPWPPAGGPSADGWLLAHWLERQGMLGDEGTIELAACRLRARWNRRTQALDVGRWFVSISVRLPHTQETVVAMRVFRWEWWRRVRSKSGGGQAPAAAPKIVASAEAR